MHPPVAPSVPATILSLPDGRDLAFAEYGDPAGVPVVAFHGTPGSHLQLAPADDAARDAGIRLIVPDRPGYGHSSLAPRRRLADWPADVLAIADHLSVARFAVLGVSGGGPHALACAASGSGRVAAASAVSSPSPYPQGTAELRGPRRWLAWLLVIPGLVRLVATVLVAVMRRYPHTVFGIARKVMPEADRRVVDDVGLRAWFVDSSRRASTTTARAVAQDVSLFSSAWCLDLGRIGIPVTVWHGADDRLVEPASADALGAAIPGATVRLCRDEGHLLFAHRAADILGELATEFRNRPEQRTTHAGTATPDRARRDRTA